MFHEKHLQRAVEIQHWIDYHQLNIEQARVLPPTFTGWEEEDRAVYVHDALNMAPEKLHDIIKTSIIADAEAQITELRDELRRMGVSMEGFAAPQPVPTPRFVVVSDHTPEPQSVPVTVLKPNNSRTVVKRMKQAVGKRR
jgi:hypothetical protein